MSTPFPRVDNALSKFVTREPDKRKRRLVYTKERKMVREREREAGAENRDETRKVVKTNRRDAAAHISPPILFQVGLK